MIYRFGEYEFDPCLYELRHSGTSIKIEPKVFDLLAYLIQHRNRVVTKAELMESLWPGEHITESALVRCVVAARKAVRDDGARQQVIKTHRGRGYRLIAPIEEQDSVRDTVMRAAFGRSCYPDAAAPQGAPTSSVFVGRQREIKELGTYLEQALLGRGRLVLMVGESGVGKTRTAEEVAAQARARHALVLTAHCYEGAGAPAFWPWVQIIRHYTRAHDPTELMAVMGVRAADIAAVVPEVRQLFPGLPASPAGELDQVQFRFFDGITTFLKDVTQDVPLVLILDDLHWADRPSLRLLQFLAREIGLLRLLVVGTYSNVGLGRHHPLTQTLGELAREEIGCRIPLRGLHQRDVKRFIESTSGQQASDALVSWVYRKTEGNPFFIKEIVRLLASDGHLEHLSELASWQFSIPQEIREVIGRRLCSLSEACNRVLSVASVIGREFSLDILEHLSHLSGDRLLEALEEAITAHVVDELPYTVGRYRFSHPLIHETLYDELTATRRVRLHRRIGETLECMYAANPEAHLDQLAHHYLQAAPAGVADKAVIYSAQAGERASVLLAYDEAMDHYGRALRILDRCPTSDPGQRLKLVLSLGEVQMKAGATEQARETFAQAEALRQHLHPTVAQEPSPATRKPTSTGSKSRAKPSASGT